MAGPQGRNIGSNFTIVRGSFAPTVLGSDGGYTLTIGGLRNIYYLAPVSPAIDIGGNSRILAVASGTTFPVTYASGNTPSTSGSPIGSGFSVVGGPTIEVQVLQDGLSGQGFTPVASGTSVSGSTFYFTAIGD